jgi:hypothetical protein
MPWAIAPCRPNLTQFDRKKDGTLVQNVRLAAGRQNTSVKMVAELQKHRDSLAQLAA